MPRWKRGVALVEESVGESLGKLYVDAYFPPASKARMEKLVANLLAACRESIDAVDWMSPATKKEAQAKLATFAPKIGYPKRWIDYATLQTQSSFTHVQPCGYFAGLAGISASDPHYALPRVPSSLFSFLPTPVLNAVRLGIGHIYACWGANFYGAQPGGTGPDGLQGNLVMSITYNYVSNNGAVNEQVGEVVGTAYGVSDCTNDGNGPNYLEAADNVVGNWPEDAPG